jgi:hypothetical protein
MKPELRSPLRTVRLRPSGIRAAKLVVGRLSFDRLKWKTPEIISVDVRRQNPRICVLNEASRRFWGNSKFSFRFNFPFIPNIWIRVNTTFDDSCEVDSVTLQGIWRGQLPRRLRAIESR